MRKPKPINYPERFTFRGTIPLKKRFDKCIKKEKLDEGKAGRLLLDIGLNIKGY